MHDIRVWGINFIQTRDMHRRRRELSFIFRLRENELFLYFLLILESNIYNCYYSIHALEVSL